MLKVNVEQHADAAKLWLAAWGFVAGGANPRTQQIDNLCFESRISLCCLIPNYQRSF